MNNLIFWIYLSNDFGNWQWLDYLIALVAFSYLATVVWIDIRSYRIPFLLSGLGVIISLAWGSHFNTVLNAILGGFVGLVFGVLLYLGGLLFHRVSKMRDRQLSDFPFGFGDIPFGCVMGMFIGWPGVINGFIFALLLAGFFSLMIIIFRKSNLVMSALPLAPFFVVGWILSTIIMK